MTTTTDTATSPAGAPPATGAPRGPGTPAGPARRPGLVARARADGVTGPAVVAISLGLVAAGVALDLRRDATLGLGTGLAVVLAALGAPAVVRFRSLPTAAVLPPLLVAGAAAAIGRLGGQDQGTRELVLDVGTTLALSAPLLFGATVATLLVVLGRVALRLARR